MDFSAVYLVEKEHTKEEFLRTLLVKLASHSDTPTDVCNAKFGEVKESTKQVILCKAHVECDYSASIGYDRKEEYWDKEKKYDSSTKSYYYEDVKKTRTVTDWQAHSGHIAGDSVGAAFNENPARAGYAEHYRIASVITTIKNKNLVENEEVAVTLGGLETVKRNCAMRVESGIRYPGDHHKDERTSSTVEVKDIECYILPYYEVDFTYDGKTYHASGFACGEPNAESELPPNNVDIRGTVNKAIKPMKWSARGCLIATIVLFFVAAICTGFDAAWTWVLFVAALASTITLYVIGNKKYNNMLNQLTTENKAQKLSNLQSAISLNGYAALTSEELELFQ